MAEQTKTSIDKVKELAPTISLFTLVVLTITLSVMSQINIGNRLDAMQAETNRRFDAMLAETNRRFDVMLAETNRRFDAIQAEDNRRFDELNRRLDATQAETNRRFDELNRRFDELFEVLRIFEGRISRLEGQASPAE